MKHSTLQKVILMAVALATSLALSAQAGQPKLSSAARTLGSAKSINPIHRLLFPASTYMYDDGSSEDSVGFGNGSQNFESLWFNQFAVIPGATTIASVDIAWGTPPFPQPIDGTPTTVCVWSDPNGDGDPHDGLLLGSVTGTMQNSNTDTFITYTFSPPVTLPAGATSFFVGNFTPMNNGPELFFESQDTNDLAPNKSWIAAMSSGAPVDINTLGNNDLIGTIDGFGLPGNWMIRADASSGSENIVLSASVRRQKGKRFVVLAWAPAEGGSINILRNGVVLGSTTDDGSFQDKLGGMTGTFTYQVCETDDGACSNVVSLKFK